MGFEELFKLGSKAIDRLFPDKIKRAEEMRKLEEMRQTGDLAKFEGHVKLMLAQIELNKIDANSGNWFQTNWRPMIGWVGAISLALMYIPKAIVMTGIWLFQAIVMIKLWIETGDMQVALAVPDFPNLGVGDVIGLLGSMLGVAGMRSYDKTQGIDTK